MRHGKEAKKGKTDHPLQGPGRVFHFRLNAHTVVESDSEVGTTTNHDRHRISIGSELGHHHRGAFIGIGASGQKTGDRSWHVGQDQIGLKSDRVENACLIVVP